jgi:hypothetical protein
MYLRGHPDCIHRSRVAKVPRTVQKGLFKDSSCDDSFDEEDVLPPAKKQASLEIDTSYNKSPVVDLNEDTTVDIDTGKTNI